MNKFSRSFAKPLREVVGKVVGETFRRQGFASVELAARWTEIIGPEIAAHSEPVKLQWERPTLSPTNDGALKWRQEPGTLVLRVEGPAALEVQHLANVICERVNRFFGWCAIARIALRQAPLRREERKAAGGCDSAAAAGLATGLSDIEHDDLRQALARLGAAVERD